MKKLLTTLLFAGAAFASSAHQKIEYLNSGTILSGSLPFSEAVKVGDTLYLSGQLGNIPGELKLAPGGIKGETIQTMKNIKAVLNTHGYTMDEVVRCTVMLADIKEWPAFNEAYKPFFKKHFPARSAFAASGLALNARVEVECFAVKQG